MKKVFILFLFTVQTFAQTTVNGLILEKRWTFPVVGCQTCSNSSYKAHNIGKVGNTLFIQSESYSYKYASNPDYYKDVVDLYTLRDNQFDTIYKKLPYIIFRNGYFRQFRSDIKWDDGNRYTFGKLRQNGDTLILKRNPLNEWNNQYQIVNFNDSTILQSQDFYYLRLANDSGTIQKSIFKTEHYNLPSISTNTNSNIYSQTPVWGNINDFVFYKKDTLVIATVGDIRLYQKGFKDEYVSNSRLYKISVNDTITYHSLEKDTCFMVLQSQNVNFPE